MGRVQAGFGTRGDLPGVLLGFDDRDVCCGPHEPVLDGDLGRGHGFGKNSIQTSAPGLWNGHRVNSRRSGPVGSCHGCLSLSE